MVQVKVNIGNTSIMSGALNAAASGIASSTGLVGGIAQSVVNAGAGAI